MWCENAALFRAEGKRKSKNATLTQRRKRAQEHGSTGARWKKQKKNERPNSKNLSENICQRAGTPSGLFCVTFVWSRALCFPFPHPPTAAKVSVLLWRAGKRPPAKGARSAGIPFSIFMCIFFYFWSFSLPWRGVAWKYAVCFFFVCES